MSTAHVLVMAKSPRPGRVKTRLCPPLRPDQAAEIAEAALRDTLEAVAGSAADRRVLALDGPPGAWLPPGFDVVPQVDGPLTARLAAAWTYAGGPGIQIGMDTPQLDPAMLDRALDLVTGDSPRDALLGLAEDGGWWLLGMRRAHPEVFAGVPMSTARTGLDQHERLTALGLSVTMMPTLRDLDTMADALAIAESAPGTRTARAVRSLVGVGAR